MPRRGLRWRPKYLTCDTRVEPFQIAARNDLTLKLASNAAAGETTS
jgi:hypothetical protein